MSILPTDQRSSTTSVGIPLKIDQDRQGRKTDHGVGPPFSSWITDQAMTELTQNKTEINNLLINSQCATKTTRATVTLEFNDQERKTL